MHAKLQFASLITLSLLSGFVLAIILAASYFTGNISWQILIGITILFNFIMWLAGPYISDFIYRIFYKIEFCDYEQIKQYPYAKFIKKVCDKHGIKVPKIGIIKDQNPTSFTYGSAPFNARLILTEGIFKFLNEKELEAVIAHELGHIVNKDFIIMAIASTLLQILYELYVIFARSRSRAASYPMDKKGEKKGGYLVIIGYAALFFYWVGSYGLLYLSRLREYYADEFSAKETGDPNLLSSALIKIAYGIASVPDTEKTAHLLNNARAQGIFDFKAAKEVGLIYQNAGNKKELIERSLLFDIVNPWAWVLQLKSTHPLTGKRIKRLCSLTASPAFNFDDIINKEVDKKKLWNNFFADFFVNYSPAFVILMTFLTIFLEWAYKIDYYASTLIIGLILLIIASIIKIRYKFPLNNFDEINIINCMADVYASPVKGKPVKLTGKAIGRGQAGFIFGEDMIFQDKTGLMYLNYESAIPLFGNLFFAWKKLESLLGKPATSAGWFLRGATHHLELYTFQSRTETIKSYVRFWTIVGLVINAVFWSFIIFLMLYFVFNLKSNFN